MKRTPSDEEVFSAFALSDDLQEELPGLAWEQIITKEAFTRWLAGHDREVEARGLEKAADEWQTKGWAHTPRHADRVADRMGASQYALDWMRARAQQVREGNA